MHTLYERVNGNKITHVIPNVTFIKLKLCENKTALVFYDRFADLLSDNSHLVKSSIAGFKYDSLRTYPNAKIDLRNFQRKTEDFPPNFTSDAKKCHWLDTLLGEQGESESESENSS